MLTPKPVWRTLITASWKTPMLDGVAGHDRGDVDREQDRGGGADPGLAVEAERVRTAPSRRRAGSPRRSSCAAAAASPRRGLRKTPSPARTWTSARCIAAPIRASRPLPLRRISSGARRTSTSSTERHEAEDEELLGAGVEEVGVSRR